MIKPARKGRAPFWRRMQDRGHAYLLNHAHSLFSSLGRLSRSPFNTSMTILVLSTIVAMAGGFYIAVANLQLLTGNLKGTNQISLFLQESVSENAALKLAEQLRRREDMQDVKLITKKQAFEEFKQHSGFADALKILDFNPLPHVLQLTPKSQTDSAEQANALTAEFRQWPQVYFVQVDMQWIARLQAIMQLVDSGVKMAAGLLALAVTFIAGNTIRLELQNRQDEVYISKLVGATQAFIQRPFLYAGFWLGFISGLFGWFIITVELYLLQGPVERLASLYEGGFGLRFMNFREFLGLLLASTTASLVGAWLVLNYQLRQLKPQ